MKRYFCIILVLVLSLTAYIALAEGTVPAGERTYADLKKGSKGDEVRLLQERLNELGFSAGKPDGVFGRKTQMAVEAFQVNNGIIVTGVADQETQRILFSEDAAQPTPEPTQTPKPTSKPRPTNTPRPTSKPNSYRNSGTDWAAIGRALDNVDVNGDGYLSYDEVFK